MDLARGETTTSIEWRGRQSGQRQILEASPPESIKSPSEKKNRGKGRRRNCARGNGRRMPIYREGNWVDEWNYIIPSFIPSSSPTEG
jgi:hypothetical protein